MGCASSRWHGAEPSDVKLVVGAAASASVVQHVQKAEAGAPEQPPASPPGPELKRAPTERMINALEALEALEHATPAEAHKLPRLRPLRESSDTAAAAAAAAAAAGAEAKESSAAPAAAESDADDAGVRQVSRRLGEAYVREHTRHTRGGASSSTASSSSAALPRKLSFAAASKATRRASAVSAGAASGATRRATRRASAISAGAAAVLRKTANARKKISRRVYLARKGLKRTKSPLLSELEREVDYSKFTSLLAGCEGCTVQGSAERALTLRELKRVRDYVVEHCVAERWEHGLTGELLVPETVNLYDVTRYIILPSTRKRKCSFFELVGSGPRRPLWFISHWWGEPFVQFVSCVEQHAADHGLDDDTAYWVCAFALNQHGIDDSELNSGSTENPFVRAISHAEGRMLSVLDHDCVTYTRAWCMLEMDHALEIYHGASFDIYTSQTGSAVYDMTSFEEVKAAVGEEGFRGSEWLEEVYRRLPIVRNRNAVGLTMFPTKSDRGEPMAQTLRQSSFPLKLLVKGLNFRMQDMQATVESDLAMIYNFIAGRPDMNEDGSPNEPLEECEAYERMNNNVRGCFAAAGWKPLLVRPEDHATCSEKLAVSAAKSLSISFRNTPSFTDDAARALAGALPRELEEIRLEFTTSAATSGNVVLNAVFERVTLSGIRVLEMSDCLLSCEIPEAIGALVAMDQLTLAGNKMVGSLPGALGRCRKLREMRCQNNQLTGELPTELGNCTELELVRLNGNRFTGTLPASLGNCVKLYELRLMFNQLSGPIPEELCQCALRSLAVDEPLLANLPKLLQDRKEAGTLQLNVPRR